MKFLLWGVSVFNSGQNTISALLKLKCFVWCQAVIGWHQTKESQYSSKNS